MTYEIKTLELARIYESQGYVEDALKIYSSLCSQTPSDEIKAGLNRMRIRLKTQTENQIEGQTYIQLASLAQSLSSDLDSDKPVDPEVEQVSNMAIRNIVEQWLTLMVLEDRMNRIIKFERNGL